MLFCDTVILYAFLLFGHSDGMTALLGKVCPDDAQCDTGVLGESQKNGSGITIKNKRKLSSGSSEQRSTEKVIVLQIRDDAAKNSHNGGSSSLEAIENDNVAFSKLILELPATTEEMKAEALDMLIRMQRSKK
jgi:hypothetical protein